MGNHLLKLGFPDVVTALYKDLLQQEGEEIYKAGNLHTTVDLVMYLLRTLFWNFSDASFKFADYLGSCGYLHLMAKDLKHFSQLDHKPDEDEEDGEAYAFNSSLSVLHNCAKVPRLRQLFRDLDMVTILQPFLKWESEQARAIAIMTLGYITDETQNDILAGDEEAFAFIINILNLAIQDPVRRYNGFSTMEMATGLGVLARKDENKKIIVKKGGLKPLKLLIMTGDEEEISIATNSVWVLAFDQEARTLIKEDEEFMKRLNELGSHQNPQLKKEAEGAMWVIKKDEREKRINDNAVDEELGISSSTSSSSSLKQGKHIMISYNWGNQDKMIRVKDRLKKAGFNVWMDVERMGGSTLGAMAEAVENSSVVLMCMSEQYKESENCRLEGEYVFLLKKEIMPLIMQRGYKPDGWLGILLGAKYFFDFSGKFKFDDKVDELVSKLLEKFGNQGGNAILAKEVATTAPVYGSKKKESAKDWSQERVQEWLKENGLNGIPSLKGLTGPQLSFLQKMHINDSGYFYSYADTRLGIKKLEDLMNFCEALDRVP